MRRDRPNPTIEDVESSIGGVLGDVAIITDPTKLSEQTKPFVMLVSDTGILQYKREDDGSYTLVSTGTSDGEHTQIILEDITPEEIEEKWND